MEIFNCSVFTFYFTNLFEKLQGSGMPIVIEYKSGVCEALVVNDFAAAPSSGVCILPGLRVIRRFPIGNKRRAHGFITDETCAPTHPAESQ